MQFFLFDCEFDLNILFKIFFVCSLCIYSSVCPSIFLFLSLSLSLSFLSNSSPFCLAVQVSNICFRKISKIRKNKSFIADQLCDGWAHKQRKRKPCSITVSDKRDWPKLRDKQKRERGKLNCPFSGEDEEGERVGTERTILLKLDKFRLECWQFYYLIYLWRQLGRSRDFALHLTFNINENVLKRTCLLSFTSNSI